MVFAVSDIHGCFKKYKALMDYLRLSDTDTLYILGDILDRGDGGIKTIFDLLSRKNVVCLRGNHDHTAFILLRHLLLSDDGFDSEMQLESFQLWLSDGGATTFSSFFNLGENEQKQVLAFLNSMPFYKEIQVQGNKFLLAHTVPEKETMLKSKKTAPYDYIFGEPEYEKVYFDDTVIVTGHTPTGFIDPNYTGRIWKGNNHIAIDCGAVFGNPLGCICLDTMKEIYVEEQSDGHIKIY